jgi:fumarate reductase subunit D
MVLYPEHWRGRAEISDEEVWFLVVLRTENELVGLHRKNHGVHDKQVDVAGSDVV